MRRGLSLALVVLAWAVAAEALVVSEVRHSRRSFDPAKGESAEISFRLSAAADTSLHIYDGRDLEIRRIDLGALSAGAHRARWDGRDAWDRLVPPEAYTYALTATKGGAAPVVWDLGNTGGEQVYVHDIQWDPDRGLLHYRIDRPARVRIRIGLANDGPLLRTLIDWVPRAAGTHQEPWDGKDSAEVFDLASHPNLALAPEAFALPPNTLLVSPPPARVELIAGLLPDTPRREREPPQRHRMFEFARTPIEQRRDFPVTLEPVGAIRRTPEGLPVVDGELVLRLGVSDADLAAVLSQRCEAVFYVDGQFVFEREMGFLPMTWTWKPTTLNEGIHHITANVRGYEGHFGMTTLAVMVEAGEDE